VQTLSKQIFCYILGATTLSRMTQMQVMPQQKSEDDFSCLLNVILQNTTIQYLTFQDVITCHSESVILQNWHFAECPECFTAECLFVEWHSVKVILLNVILLNDILLGGILIYFTSGDCHSSLHHLTECQFC